MEKCRNRNSSYFKDLFPVCTQIKKVSVDVPSAVQLKKPYFKLDPIFINSENQKISRQKVCVSVQKLEKPLYKRKLEKIQTVPAKKSSELCLKPLCPIPITASCNFEKKMIKVKSIKKNPQSVLGLYSSEKLKSRVVSKVSYSQASQNSDWALIAKPEIEKMWKNLVWLSNGIVPIKEKAFYNYFIEPGNHSELIRKLLSDRGWSETSVLAEANFIWTQCKEAEVFEILPKGNEIVHELDANASCSFSYQVPVKIAEDYRKVDISDLGFQKIKDSFSFVCLKTTEFLPSSLKLYNKLEFDQYLCDDRFLVKSMKKYYSMMELNVFDVVPLTFCVISVQDQEFKKFLNSFKRLENRKRNFGNVWIVKICENLNTSRVVRICRSLNEIVEVVGENPEGCGFVIKKYIEKQFLVNNRKFDIRCFALVTSINGVMQGYFYSEGYLNIVSIQKTSSTIEGNSHYLSKESTQKHFEDQISSEDNKLSYNEFQNYLNRIHPDKSLNFHETVLPKLKKIVQHSISVTSSNLNPNKRQATMQIFEYNFILDTKLTPWLIKITPTPSLNSSLLPTTSFLPTLFNNLFQIVIDCFFPQTTSIKNTFEPIVENKFELIFHEYQKSNL